MSEVSSIVVHREVDAIGMNCPLPILRTKKTLAEMQTGEVLKLKATDSGATHDIPAFCKQTGHIMLSLEETKEGETTVYIFHIQKKAA